MLKILITKEKVEDFIKKLQEQFEVYGPVSRGGMHSFEKVTLADKPDLSYFNSRLSPKGLFLPQSECMFEYTLKAGAEDWGILHETAKDLKQRVLFGIRPCDVHALKLVDRNFITAEFKDPWWVQRRDETTLIGLGCNKPGNTCFCTSVGGGPFDEKGLDVLLYDLEDSYLAKALTEKGERVLEMAPGSPPDDAALSRVEQLRADSESQFRTHLSIENLKERDLVDLFNDPLWKDVEFACINCGTCTFLCPTCWCFDIQDEVYKDHGDRIRNWDSCMFPLFTLHGSGHNPRAQKVQRVRQRFMHKLKYYVDKYDDGVACVGCGRCIQFCPVNIDIRHVIELMSDTSCARKE